jgi:hypothetical protein
MSQKKRFLLRLDSKLYEVLEKWSADELRSVNAQIEYLLKEATRKAGRLKEEKRSAESSADAPNATNTSLTLTRSHQHTTEPELEVTPEDTAKTDPVQQ